ncbi:PREDICTED: ABSCISIC ACID-INSENSITIVE 5-like protein 7 [Ipomoea nil]|uniref:ABSCISIC ACID-INSENSITIVE 5-like protein 7 n=1 Tax=Ipomoea nil TaxID=35883 RepID=UPI000901EC23|nr:PREDICTED: ABSCISIC ACID-INSENSITIVE 5-like protein 7 [Ipomoea nil]
MASTSAAPANPDRPHQPSSPSIHAFADQLHSDHTRGYGSMNMDDIIKSIYADTNTLAAAADSCSSSGGAGGGGNKTVDEVWREIVSGGGGGGGAGGGSRDPEMTLEDFLTKAGAVREEDVRVPAIPPPPPPAAAVTPGFKVDAMVNAANCQFPVAMQTGPGGFGVEPPHMGFGNGVVAIGCNSGSSGGGRGKRRATVEEMPLDKATQQKQRRMIKNRESAARSRERKQAYTVELESLVTQLEEDNARLLREEAEQNKKRLKQLMENLIPVVEKRRPPRVLRRIHSMTW